MNNDYRDITDRLGQPQWWDECAVPRYCDFRPDECANIYANEVVLFLIECQNCGREFQVAKSSTPMGRYIRNTDPPEFYPTLEDRVRDNSLHYGDPPNYNCCAAGPTMNSVPIRVLEFWKREQTDWKRVPELEVGLDVEWAGPR